MGDNIDTQLSEAELDVIAIREYYMTIDSCESIEDAIKALEPSLNVIHSIEDYKETEVYRYAQDCCD